MGLAIEIVGLVVFLGAHVFVSMHGHRAALIARVGEGPYKGLFSLVSLVGLVLLSYGFARYRTEGVIPLWYPPVWTRYIVQVAMWPASIAVVVGTIVFLALGLLFHPLVIGVPVFGTPALGH